MKEDSYKKEDGFRYDIVAKTIVKNQATEELPKCFLADTPEEAEKRYLQFEKMLNNIAYYYSVSTGLNKADLFGEALIGLSKAYRDWDSSRSKDFKMYATFVIKDSLNEFVRNCSATVKTPSYIKKANANLSKLKSICFRYNEVSWRAVVNSKTVPNKFNQNDSLKCNEIFKNILNASIRAGVEYKKFIERIETIPESIDMLELDEDWAINSHKRNEELMEASLVVDKIKQYLGETELTICNGIMEDKSLEQIGMEMGKSKSWVSNKLKKLREKVYTIVEGSDL